MGWNSVQAGKIIRSRMINLVCKTLFANVRSFLSICFSVPKPQSAFGIRQMTSTFTAFF